MGLKVHHTGVVPRDLEKSLRFWRDGIGLEILSDVPGVEGDWPRLFGLGTHSARTISLGDPADRSAGVLELVVFEDGFTPPPPAQPSSGFLLVSFVGVDVEAMLDRLRSHGFEPVGRMQGNTATAAFEVATVRDPDGVLVELVGTARPL
jgi:catechol 2,3-dioxygenase-like lactoylglutathione lyase family enzyme